MEAARNRTKTYCSTILHRHLAQVLRRRYQTPEAGCQGADIFMRTSNNVHPAEGLWLAPVVFCRLLWDVWYGGLTESCLSSERHVCQYYPPTPTPPWPAAGGDMVIKWQQSASMLLCGVWPAFNAFKSWRGWQAVIHQTSACCFSNCACRAEFEVWWGQAGQVARSSDVWSANDPEAESQDCDAGLLADRQEWGRTRSPSRPAPQAL